MSPPGSRLPLLPRLTSFPCSLAGRYRLARRLGWPQPRHEHAAASAMQARWRGVRSRRVHPRIAPRTPAPDADTPWLWLATLLAAAPHAFSRCLVPAGAWGGKAAPARADGLQTPPAKGFAHAPQHTIGSGGCGRSRPLRSLRTVPGVASVTTSSRNSMGSGSSSASVGITGGGDGASDLHSDILTSPSSSPRATRAGRYDKRGGGGGGAGAGGGATWPSEAFSTPWPRLVLAADLSGALPPEIAPSPPEIEYGLEAQRAVEWHLRGGVAHSGAGGDDLDRELELAWRSRGDPEHELELAWFGSLGADEAPASSTPFGGWRLADDDGFGPVAGSDGSDEAEAEPGARPRSVTAAFYQATSSDAWQRSWSPTAYQLALPTH